MRTSSRGLVLDAAAICGWPTVHPGRISVASEDAWRSAVSRSTPGERLDLLRLLEAALLRATEGGQARLRAAEVAAGVEGLEPTVHGDREALPLVRTALALVPPAVRRVALREVLYLAVGWGTRAWTCSASIVNEAGRRLARLVVLGPDADVLTVVHEVAHVWHAGPPRKGRPPAISTRGELGLGELARREGWFSRLEEHSARSEVLADALALGWVRGGALARSGVEP